MGFLYELRGRVDALAQHSELDVDAESLTSAVSELDDDALVEMMRQTTAISQQMDRLRALGAGTAARRSARERGRDGLAQTRGHRSPVSLVQDLTGTTRADAAKHVRLGESLLEAHGSSPDVRDGEPDAPDASGDEPGTSDDEPDISATAQVSWHAPIDDALLAGRLSAAFADIILRNLGSPPVREGADDPSATVIAAWHAAAAQLVDEANHRNAEDLAVASRQVRDLIDPEGAHARFLARYQARHFRMYTDADGVQRASISFDDEMAAWVRSITDSALRPRRGGPRFVDPAESARAQELIDDPRTLDQLTYDLMMDVIRAGAVADAEQVFGTRQAGVRLVTTVSSPSGEHDAFGRSITGPIGAGHTEDGGHPLPAPVLERASCAQGYVEVTVDACGNPLDVGREQRLFTSRQRVALAVRDGGCIWPRCDRPASYCEAHHIDEWKAERGRTDVDRGVLLCRFHHMNLHHHGWRIRRRGRDPFTLHHPHDSGEPIVMRTKSGLRWQWAQPPPARAG